jgi:hypothetical protein
MGVALAGRRWYLLNSVKTQRENWVVIPIIIIIGILLFYSIYSVYLSTPSRPQLSIYSEDWSDLSKCRNALDTQGYKISSIISSPTILSKLNESKNKVYVAIGVERSYTADEVAAIWDFMRNGGSIIIADDFGHGNSLSDQSQFWNGDDLWFGDDLKFSNHRLYDVNYIKNTKFVTVNATLLGQNYYLVLNEPAALESQLGYYDSYNLLAASTENSWLDKNNNGVRDPREIKRSYNLIARFYDRKFNCTAVVISDPGLFINENWHLLDNYRFVLNLFKVLLPNGGEIIFDESRHINQDAFENTRHVLYSAAVYLTSSVASIFLIAIILIIGSLVIGVKIKPQNIYRNKNLLKTRYLNVLNYPYFGPYDYWQMYSGFLERVRLGYGFSEEEFKELDRETLYNLIGDQQLWDFLSRRFPVQTDHEYYKYMLSRIISWSPQHPEQMDRFDKKYNPEQNDEEKSNINNIDESDSAEIPINKFITRLDDKNERDHNHDNDYRWRR